MNTEIQKIIISILGTLSGTILGWLLNEFSKLGKLKLYISEWNAEFLLEKYVNLSDYITNEEVLKDNNNTLHLRKDKANNKNEANHYEYSFSLDIYNNSGDTKIMRNLRIVFYDKYRFGKKKLFEDSKLKIQTNRKDYEKKSETLEVINISPKNIIRLHLTNDIKINDILYDTTDIYLEYLNEKNMKKKIMVNTVDYKHYF